MTAGILLAAGQSRRFGGDKQLAEFQGHSLLARSARLLVESDLWPRVVVLSGAKAVVEQRHRAAIGRLDVRVGINAEPHRGMSSSICIGLREVLSCSPDVEGVVITVCDQILCTSQHLRMLVISALSSKSEIVASGYSEVAGVPAYFHRRMFAELEKLEGEKGAGSLIRTYKKECHILPFPDGNLDIDTPSDFEKLRAYTP